MITAPDMRELRGGGAPLLLPLLAPSLPTTHPGHVPLLLPLQIRLLLRRLNPISHGRSHARQDSASYPRLVVHISLTSETRPRSVPSTERMRATPLVLDGAAALSISLAMLARYVPPITGIRHSHLPLEMVFL